MSVYVPVETQRTVREQFKGRCAYCQTLEALTVITFEFDHIVPLSAQGQTVAENLCLACPACNRYKARRQSAVDPATGETVPLFHPQHQIWSKHFAWNEDTTAVIGLTPIGRATVAALKMNRSQMSRLRRMWREMGEHPPE